MRNTIKNVTIVVLVLITSCQVSENPKIGPLAAQTTTAVMAVTKAHGEPIASEVRWANLRNRVLIRNLTSCISATANDDGLMPSIRRTYAIQHIPARTVRFGAMLTCTGHARRGRSNGSTGPEERM